ncbi:MAG: hypothetical protein JSS81_26355 [Acidobacteria bacterium]|nr:hypothetical protein [Acidobacteriota bacterium]
MQINGLENISAQQLNQELAQGARFVLFEYCISLIIVTFKRPSAVYYIRPGEGTFGKSIGFTLITLLFGWWGIPWGPIYSIMSLVTNLGGGKNITAEIVNAMNRG